MWRSLQTALRFDGFSSSGFIWITRWSESHSVVSNSFWPCGLYFPGQNNGVGSLSLIQGIFPAQGLNPGIPHLQADSLPAELPGKPKSTGVGSLSLLQGIFLTQESNWGLLHCRQILYQLSYDIILNDKQTYMSKMHISIAKYQCYI